MSLRVNDLQLRILPNPTLAAVQRLLEDSSLPFADLDQPMMAHFIGLALADVCNDHDLIGVVGLQLCGPIALLRSLAVSPDGRGHGYGFQLVSAAESHASDKGVDQIFLLTETAADFFARHGYRAVSRAEAPQCIRDTTEFSSLCPSTSTLMHKRLVD